MLNPLKHSDRTVYCLPEHWKTAFYWQSVFLYFLWFS
jgi:hypothetical protein